MCSPSASALADAGNAYLGRSYSDMDCQAFVELCLKDIGISLNLPGSNAWYRRMTWTGTPEECNARFGCVPTGAFLFILLDDGKEPVKYRDDGIGNASHIGIRTASGAIHSSASRGCVAASSFEGKSIRGGWNRVGLWDALDYGPDINSRLSAFSLDSSGNTERSETAMKALVFCDIGSSVKLRNSPSLSEPLYWDIPDGTSVTVLERGERWSRIQAPGHTGYMLSSFLRFSDEPSSDAVTLSLKPAMARSLLPILDTLIAQLESTVGRG